MYHSEATKLRARLLRAQGMTLREIAASCGIALGTASLWLKDAERPPSGRRMQERIRKYRASMALRRDRRDIQERGEAAYALAGINGIALRILAALWWCEGTKNIRARMAFTNADPRTIQYFLRLFREVFNIDEKRLRVTLHLHEYHVKDEELRYWSTVTKIPLSQFHKPYLKPHTGRRKKAGYRGCARIHYLNARVARILKASWDIISMGEHGGIVQR